MKGTVGAALGLAELHRLEQHFLRHVAEDARHVAAVDADRDVLEGEHRALDVLGEGGLLALEVAEEALADIGRDVVHQAGDQVGRAALRKVALQDREEVALDRTLDRDRDRRVELGNPREADDDRLGEGAVQALEHARGDLRAQFREDDRHGLRDARPGGRWRARAPGCRSAAPRSSGPRCAGGRREAAGPRPRRRAPRRGACAPPSSRRRSRGRWSGARGTP